MKVHNDNSAKSGRALVPNRRAPQGPNVGGVSLPAGTGPSLSGTGTGTETGIGTGTGTGTGASTSGLGPTTSSTTETSQPTTSTTTSVSDTQTTTSSTSPTTTVPSTTITSSSTTTTSTTTTSNTNTSTSRSLTSPPLSLTDSRQPLITSTIWSTFLSTLPDGEVQSFTTPIPTALVSSAPNSSSMNRTTAIVASTVSAFAFILLLVLAALFIWRRKGTRLKEQQEREKGKEMRRLLEDEDFAVDYEDRWSGGGQNRNFAPSLNSGFGGPPLSLRQISPLRGPTPSIGNEISGQPPLTPIHARTSSSSSSSSSSPSVRRPSSSNSTLLPPPSLPDTPRGHSSQGRSSLQLTPVPSSSSSTWISRPIAATLSPYKDPFGVGPPLPPATLSGISPKLPVTTQSPLSPPPKSLVASLQSYRSQSPGEWLRSPKSPTFPQAVTMTMMTVDTTTPAAADATATSQQSGLHKKQSTVSSIADSVSEYSQESAPLHVLSSRLAGRSGEPPPPVPPVPLMPLRPR